jgi:polyribonucleotide nucleotidyltransferase
MVLDCVDRMSEVKKFSLPEFGYEVQLGNYAKQADGAVWLQNGGTVVLSTVVSGASRDEFPGFLPLSVDYREMFAAAGKFPGGYFKREGKMTDKEVLTSRLIDRSIRPLFPDKFFQQVQVLSTVYSVDKENMPNMMALVSCSLALTISSIPFFGPVGVVEIGLVDSEWIVNPTYSQAKKSKSKLIVAGTEEGVCMLEGCTDNMSEDQLLDLIDLAHKKIKIQIDWQKEIAAELKVEKSPLPEDSFDWALWEGKAKSFFTHDRLKSIYGAEKQNRSKAIKDLYEVFIQDNKEQIGDNEVVNKKTRYALDYQLKNSLTDFILIEGSRVDGRKFDEVRKITSEVGVLPFTHGSSVFTRGETQALVSTTLGTGQDVQRIDNLMGDLIEKKFLLHYNFPPFSTGDVRPMRGPGRREVGHGALAASAILPMLPDESDFPYVIRVVSDILESNGSSSMATVCGATMALMDAGVPIKDMVSGIAMGLLKDSNNNFQALTDISGFEDAFGWMDFKVAGTDKGITAIQLDIKNKGGLPREIFEIALRQANTARKHIMDRMRDTLSAPRKELSELVPKMVTFKIDQDKIGAVIGAGGKIIREIIDKTSVTIDIEDDGMVKIFGKPGEGLEKAIDWVKTLAGKIENGSIYNGKVRRITDFGIFVELVPGLDGLLHISNIPREDQNNIAALYPTDSDLEVVVMNYDSTSGRIKLGFTKKN